MKASTRDEQPLALPIAALELPHERVPAQQHVAGSPTTATAELGSFKGVEYGIWEMTPGTSTDIETDEVFVVVSGRARIEFPDDGYSIEVAAGDLVRLATGQHTVWHVTETLRKVYFSG